MDASHDQATFTFPKGFLWGAASSSYQVEGGIESSDWAAAARESRVPLCGQACDHYHRFGEDFDIAKDLGHNAHRFSIEWSRIEPEEGVFDEKEIEHYRAVLRALRARGLKPMVTLWHISQPVWFALRGGFLRKDSARLFVRYSRFVAEHLGSEADLWIPINEPEIVANNGYIRALWPPFRFLRPWSAWRIMRHMAAAHRGAYAALKEVRPDLQVGVNKDNIYFEANRNPFNKLACAFLDFVWNYWFLDMTRGSFDFIGLNHYFHQKLGISRGERARVPRNDMGWELSPVSLYRCLVGLRRYGAPVYVTENGIADRTDAKRAAFILNALHQVAQALKEGVDVRGYFYWSLTDNYEWAEGFAQRFGLVSIDYGTLARTVRPSARVYAEVCRNNVLPPPAGRSYTESI